jgi:hypothetical protein
MIRLCLLLTSFAFCQTNFLLIKDSLNTPVEHRQYIYSTITDSLNSIEGNKVLDSLTLASFANEFRTDRLAQDSIESLMSEKLGYTHKLLFKFNPVIIKENRWVWVPFVGEQKVTTSFNVKIMDSKDSTLLSTQYEHTYIIDDWYCGIWECTIHPIPAAEEREIIGSSLERLLGAFAEDIKKVKLEVPQEKNEDKKEAEPVKESAEAKATPVVEG